MGKALMKFDPAAGTENPYPSHPEQYREYHGQVAWLFNPYNGERRSALAVGGDPFGFLVHDGGALTAVAAATPKLGEVWPGQGGIYAGIVRGQNGQPDHYLIIPTHRAAEFHKVALGTYDQDVTGATSKSDGMANTRALADAGSDLCKEILELEIDGHRDWYLMAANEAHIAAANVPELFEKEGWYWTSTQHGRYGAFVQDFEYGHHINGLKLDVRRARAVRRIQLSPSVPE